MKLWVNLGCQISQQKIYIPKKWFWPNNLYFNSTPVHSTTAMAFISQKWGFETANMRSLVIECVLIKLWNHRLYGEFCQLHINWNSGFHHLSDKVILCARRKLILVSIYFLEFDMSAWGTLFGLCWQGYCKPWLQTFLDWRPHFAHGWFRDYR